MKFNKFNVNKAFTEIVQHILHLYIDWRGVCHKLLNVNNQYRIEQFARGAVAGRQQQFTKPFYILTFHSYNPVL
jgi:hypothetical protein